MKGVGVLHRAYSYSYKQNDQIRYRKNDLWRWKRSYYGEEDCVTNTNTNTNKLKIKQVRLYNGSLTFIVQVQVHISSKSSTDKIGTEGYVSTYALVN